MFGEANRIEFGAGRKTPAGSTIQATTKTDQYENELEGTIAGNDRIPGKNSGRGDGAGGHGGNAERCG